MAAAADLARLSGCEAEGDAELMGRETEGVAGRDSNGQQFRWKWTAEGGRKWRSGSERFGGFDVETFTWGIFYNL